MEITCSECSYKFTVAKSPPNTPQCCTRCHFITKGRSSKNYSIGLHPILAERYYSKEKIPKKKSEKVSKAASTNDKVAAQAARIPGYEILECVGQGAMGFVYRALRVSDQKEVAVKILSQKMADNADLVARFEREAAALRSFRHENIVAIIDSGVSEHMHYLCMEFIEGTTLRKILRNDSLNPTQAINYTQAILAGLAAAHKRGVIHRDLKPENVLVQTVNSAPNKVQVRIVLVDFGLAGIINEQFDPHPNLTQSRMSMGTINYMAPEQSCDAKRVDLRCDIYSCGVILYECLTGSLPTGRYRLPSEKNSALPVALDHCILKALNQQAENRYHSAREFSDALQKILNEISQHASSQTLVAENPNAIPQNTLTTIKSNYFPYLFGFVILIFGISLGVFFSAQ